MVPARRDRTDVVHVEEVVPARGGVRLGHSAAGAAARVHARRHLIPVKVAHRVALQLLRRQEAARDAVLEAHLV